MELKKKLEFRFRRKPHNENLTLEQRIARSERRWRIAAKAWAISYFILTVGLASALYGVWQGNRDDTAQARRNDYVICQNSNQARETVRNFILTLIERSDKTLDSLEYYKHHPQEREAAHKANAQAKVEAQNQLMDIPCGAVADVKEGEDNEDALPVFPSVSNDEG